MKIRKPPHSLLARRGVLSAVMVGLALAFIIMGRTPGPLFYTVGGTLAVVFFALSFTDWQRTGWLGILAYTILVSGLMVGTNGVLGLLTGLFLAGLTALKSVDPDAEEEVSPTEASGTLERFQPDAQ